MVRTKELFQQLKEKELQDDLFLKEHIIFCTLEPQKDCDNSPIYK